MLGFKAVRLLASVFVLLLVQLALAGTAQLLGQVTVKGPDAPVFPISGAFVMLSNPAQPSVTLAIAQTDANGNYAMQGLNPGTYVARFSKTGFLQGVTPSFNLVDSAIALLNASLVPSLSATEIGQPDEKSENTFTVHNPNYFAVTYMWSLPNHKLSGIGLAPPGDSVLATNAAHHTEKVRLFVDGSSVELPSSKTTVPPPVVESMISGYVTSGSPLGGVLVTVRDSNNNLVGSTQTLTDGSYVFHNLAAGSYTLSFSLTGYFPASTSIVFLGGALTVPTEALTPIPPPPTATVNVTVTQSDTGAGIPGVTVTISYTGGSSVVGTTDGNGLASFSNQPVSIASVISAATNDGSNRMGSTSSSGFVAGANSVPIVIQPIPRGSVSGMVTDMATGVPLGGAMVTVMDGGLNVVGSGQTVSDGTYMIGNIVAGAYSMTFSLATYQTANVPGVVVASGANTTQNEALSAIPPPTATVNVTVTQSDTGAGIPGVTVTISYTSGSTAIAPTDGNGLAQFTNQPINASAVISAATNDGSNRTGSTSTTGFAAGANSVPIVLQPIPKGSISGVVTDNNNVPLGNVQVTVLDANANPAGGATTVSDGSYSISGVPQGNYSLTFTLVNYNPATSNVVVNSGANTTQNAQLTPVVPPSDATVNVTVNDSSSGLPVAGVTVSITYSNGTIAGPGLTDGNGFVSFSNQPTAVSATVSAQLVDPASGVLRTGSTASAGFFTGPNALSVQLSPAPPPPPSATVNVSVVDVNGAAVAGASVTITYTSGPQAGPTLTDASGNVAFSGQPVGVAATVSASLIDVTGTVQKSGSTPIANGFVNGTNSVTVSISPPPPPPSASVTINVTDNANAGSAINGATVAIYFAGSTTPFAVQSTDLAGNASFTSLPVGVSAVITVSTPDGRLQSLSIANGLVAGSNPTIAIAVN
ncbi:MAG: carboxypeptidase regulatory-like domain-containing protein [Fimbriimonas ginsengisoli]|uniref:Carboxypeptidase regulatory-like domain-containing protein n=1 Tax=Fimbriimonas ginsengisoli TaxID=1005039 RepID=A0A931LS50_FIMGI|nr:carboxypeptidase regulatory-like domain-containing protein [Fimbriimonas ginsengisoli]